MSYNPMVSGKSLWRKDVIGWSLYDFANTIYSMNIISLYLKRHLIEDLGYENYYFDIPYSLSMLIAAILLPALGAMSDHGTKKKIFLFLFTISCCLSVGIMAFVPPGAVLILMLLLVISNFSYEAGQPYYNALLYSVSEGKEARFVSGIGVGFGYVGSVLGMILVMPFVTGGVFGVDLPLFEAGGKEASFLPTAVLFMLFALPLFWWVREKPVQKKTPAGWATSYREVWNGLKDTRKYPGVRRFLIADYFFEDAVATVIVNIGLYCSVVIGLAEQQITAFLVMSTVAAVVGSFLIGKLAQTVSLKRMLNYIVLGWIVCLLLFVFVENMAVIWILGSLIGILLGGLWTVSRPLLAELVPKEELGRFFGLFSLSGRAAAVLGPVVWSAVLFFFAADRYMGRTLGEGLGVYELEAVRLPYRLAVISLVVMMVIGLFIFRKVPDTQGEKRG